MRLVQLITTSVRPAARSLSTSLVLMAGLSACATTVPGVGTLSPNTLTNKLNQVRADQERKEQQAEAEKQRKAQEEKDQVARAEQEEKDKALRAEREAQRAKEEAESAARAAEEAKRKEALAQKAKTQESLVINELGVKISVPGDVTYKAHKTTKYGDPAMLLHGEVSRFQLIVTNAEEDRYGLMERMRAQMGEFTYGIDVIRSDEKKNGSWVLEYSYPEYFTDGTRAGTGYGVFARHVVGGKKFNCLIAGVQQQAIGGALKACQSIKPVDNRSASR